MVFFENVIKKKAQLFLHQFDRLFDVFSNQSNTLSYS